MVFILISESCVSQDETPIAHSNLVVDEDESDAAARR